ncbi:LacI family DNA-binding transcriptional regulator [Caldilinea sp.]|uniref:LacI family DNA-binding transcriptional regulator n=1 Tax=Caldilinea sp. TaxID=2293560 RepID=UPI002C66B6B4|nr:LacI family DNA-binding transcriptional regulator [Caldilinea sp.]
MIKKTTIVDIAKTAGVSVSTVSRILNNKPDVAEDTRQRVLQIIEEQRFAPHLAWQQLRSGKSRFIALHFPQDFNPLSQGIITNAALRCEQFGFTLNLIVGALSENDLLGIFRSGQADGIILVEMLVNDWRVELLRQHTTNFVMIGRCANTNGLSYVDSDISTGVIDAVAHLVELGHRHIGFITLGRITQEKEYGFTAWARHGYETACRQHDLPGYTCSANLTTESVAAATIELLDQHPHITALVTPQDAGVPGVLKAITAQGLRIPEDISIVGLLDESFAEVVTPPLTALSFSSRDLGFTAADLLIARLNDAEASPQQILVRPKLCVRGSTGPVRTTMGVENHAW